MKAIQTRYLPCTNTKGSRIKAFAEQGVSVTIPYPHELSGAAVYAKAAATLCAKMGWNSQYLVSGGLPNGDWVFCFADSERFDDRFEVGK